MRASIRGTDELARRGRALAPRQMGALLHAGLLRQMREKQAQIPKDTGALKASILRGGDDTIKADRATLTAVEYGQYVDLPQIDEARLVREAAGEMFRRAGFGGGI